MSVRSSAVLREVLCTGALAMAVFLGMATSTQAQDKYVPGTTFRDCPECPEMVVVPTGSYFMGSLLNEEGRRNDEGPRHKVTISESFAVGVYEVTFDEWDACVSGGGCGGYRPDYDGWGRRPVIDVSWNDAKAYVEWLKEKTSQEYRLLSESEWEYVARAGTKTRYWWGDGIGRNRMNCKGSESPWSGLQTAPVGMFSPNDFGLYDVHGNIMEWVQDCWTPNYNGAPVDGSARKFEDCSVSTDRVLRSSSWAHEPSDARSASRVVFPSELRLILVGLRVARTLD